MRALVASALLAVACGGGLHLPSAAPVAQPGWKTMQAEHRVAVEFATASGGREKKALRGAIAVARPGRLRLAALGPGGIRLFDLLVVDGQVSVLYAFRQMEGSTFDKAVHSMAADLSAAYLLEPAPEGRTVAHDASEVTILEPGRTVRLTKFVAKSGFAVPTLIEGEAERYHFRVEVVAVELDRPLDEKLFKQ